MMKPDLHSFAYCLDFLREQVADVEDADMVAQPDGIKNHAAWVIGHLIYASQLVGRVVGVPQWLPSGWSKRYGTGSEPVADASQYESKQELLSRLDEAQAKLNAAVSELDEARLEEPFPQESYREVFPTIRHFLTQVLVGHTSNHIGQLSVWRHAVGLPPMKRGFE